MVVTFAALIMMKQAQPALIYLVPLTLVPVFIAALVKKQFGILWRGEMVYESMRVSQSNSFCFSVQPINLDCSTKEPIAHC